MAEQYFREIDVLIGEWADNIRAEAVDALREVAEEGERGVREIIHLETTEWGRARQAGLHGPPRPYAGRIESGEMLEGVDSHVEDVSEDVWEGRWGWRRPEVYQMVQEHGAQMGPAASIKPMESLARTLDVAEDTLKGRLDSLKGA